MNPVVEKLGTAVDDWVTSHHRSWWRSGAICTPIPSSPSPSSRRRPSWSSGCAGSG